MLRTVDLFSGIGGFSLGLGMAGGFETIAFCEQDKFCQQVLRKHWPDVPIHDDIRTLPTDGFGDIDLVCGGFPCQPWSDAGKKLGTEDDRDLWSAMASIIENLRPEWVIGENVRGFVNEPMGLQRSLSDLERIGYQAVPFVIPACAVDAPHRRERVWIVANAECQRGQSGMLHAGNIIPTSPGRASDTSGTGSTRPEIVADTDTRQCDGSQKKICPRGNAADSGSEDVADTQRERLQRGVRQGKTGTEGASNGHIAKCGWWTVEPDVGRVAHGIPRRVDRLKALGNAVVPQVVCEIGKAIQASYVPGVAS